MKRKRHLGIRIGAGALVAVLMATTVAGMPLEAQAGCYNGSNIVTNNIHDHVYSSYSNVSNSYLVNNGNGTFSRVENMGDIVLLETYNSSYKMISQSTLKMELPKFGGVYAGANYNYIVFGQDNPGKTSTEVMRIVRYSKSWGRVSSASIVGGNSLKMFDGGNLDFAESGDMIYIRCSHITYDGQQANFTTSYRNSTNTFSDVQGIVKPKEGNYTGTAAQYIDAAYGVLSAVEASTLNPNAVKFTKYGTSAGNNTFHSAVTNVNCLGNAGAINGATSYFTVGGYETSSQYYLAAGTTTPLDGTCQNRNVYIAAVPRNNYNSSQISISYMTGYSAGSPNFCETPYLVKVAEDRFMVLWETRNGLTDTEKVSYVMVDGKGNKTSDINTISGCLSDCQPIIFNGQVTWYTTNGANMKIYTVSIPAAPNGSSSQPSYAGKYIYKGVDYSAVYDFSYYCNRYPDIRVLFGDKPDEALKHFINSGMAEGRQASENFDVNIYMQNYPDLRNVYGNDLKSYYMHFINNGSKEGRNARTKK